MNEPTITVVIPVAPEHRELGERAAASCGAGEYVVRDYGPGRTEARNSIVRDYVSDWVLFLDADDELMPGAIDAMRRAIKEHQGAQMVYPRLFYYRNLVGEEYRGVILDSWATVRDKVRRRVVPELFINIGYKRDRFLELGGFDLESEDDERLDMPIRFALSEDVEVVELDRAPFARINGELSTRWVGGQVGLRSDKFPSRRPFEAWLKAGKYDCAAYG